ncbi:hypothetical protein H109_05374 [Trichophyton interdigitale MR816]|uniref:DUF2306 domain-containing protein n=1 Tax=Trichophyton interdigitale (strain MR816) TaxID=1215338 RepID=A0A059J4Y2_TRIIM|nr:hypothetical protein H109_05374 [Trichophyton interdigitale MR816]
MQQQFYGTNITSSKVGFEVQHQAPSTQYQKMTDAIKLFFQKLYQSVGFSKGYNFILFFVLVGALMGFTLARFQYLNIRGDFCKRGNAAPGECFYYLQQTRYHVGIILHLGCILPASFLVCFQFVPIIRHKFIMWHRISGYLIMLLVFISNVGALVIARRTFGGTLDIQGGIGTLVLMTTVGIGLAYYNIKKLQIDQHRAWMIRSFVYMGAIITNRFIFSAAAAIITAIGGYNAVWPCDKLAYTLGHNETLNKYPTCSTFYNGSNPQQQAIVVADFNGGDENVSAAIGLNFGMAIWIAIFIHAIGVENDKVAANAWRVSTFATGLLPTPVRSWHAR